MADIRNFTLNFGPQHPAAHGVLRLVLELDGEVVQRADPHIGLLHRATEKLAETRTWVQSVPYMDRLDYVSMMCNEHAYCLATEKLLGVEVPIRGKYIRTMFDEVTRLLNHLLWIGCHALDVGAMTMALYTFREREDLMDAYEAVSGARLHAAYYRPGGVYRDLPDRMPQYQESTWTSAKKAREINGNRSGSLLDFLEDFTNRFPTYHSEYHTLLTDNRIWKQRLVMLAWSLQSVPCKWALPAPCCADRASPGTCVKAAVRRLRQGRFRYSGWRQWRQLRPLSRAHGRDAAVQQHHQAVYRLAAQEPGAGDHR